MKSYSKGAYRPAGAGSSFIEGGYAKPDARLARGSLIKHKLKMQGKRKDLDRFKGRRLASEIEERQAKTNMSIEELQKRCRVTMPKDVPDRD